MKLSRAAEVARLKVSSSKMRWLVSCERDLGYENLSGRRFYANTQDLECARRRNCGRSSSSPFSVSPSRGGTVGIFAFTVLYVAGCMGKTGFDTRCQLQRESLCPERAQNPRIGLQICGKGWQGRMNKASFRPATAKYSGVGGQRCGFAPKRRSKSTGRSRRNIRKSDAPVFAGGCGGK